MKSTAKTTAQTILTNNLFAITNQIKTNP